MYPHSSFIKLAMRIVLHGRIACHFRRPARPVLLITVPPLLAQLPTLNYGVWDDVPFWVSSFLIFLIFNFIYFSDCLKTRVGKHVFWWHTSVIKYGIVVGFSRMGDVGANTFLFNVFCWFVVFLGCGHSLCQETWVSFELAWCHHQSSDFCFT